MAISLYDLFDSRSSPNSRILEIKYRERLWRKTFLRQLEQEAAAGDTQAMIGIARHYRRRGDNRTARKWFCKAGKEGERAYVWNLNCDGH